MSVSVGRPALDVAITQAYPHLGAPIQPMNPAMHSHRATFGNIGQFSEQGSQFTNWHAPYDGTYHMQRQAVHGNVYHQSGVPSSGFNSKRRNFAATDVDPDASNLAR